MATIDTFTDTDTIPNGAAVSAGWRSNDLHVVALLTPPAWTAASLGFQGSLDGVTFYDIYDQNGVLIAVAAPLVATLIAFNWGYLPGFPYMRLRSGLPGALVNQGAARSFTIRHKLYR